MARGKGRAKERAKGKSKRTAKAAGGSAKDRVAEASRAFDRVTLVLTLVGVCAFAIFTGYLVGQYAIRMVAAPLITTERAENPGTRLVDDEAELSRTASAVAQGTSTPPPSQSVRSSQATSSTASPAPSSGSTTPSVSASASSSSQGARTIYRVQVGGFSSRAEATSHADALKRGEPGVPDAWVLFDDAAGVYRVQAGAFGNEQRAREFLSQLQAQGYEAFIAP